MKKLITLLLVAVMCLSFVACGGGSGSAKEEIVGEWKCPAGGYAITFNEDGTGIDPEDGELTWKYDSELSCYTAMSSEYGRTISVTIKTTDDGLRYINIAGEKYYHIDDYDKGVEIEYSKAYDKLMEYYSNKTKVEIGQTIITKNEKFAITFVNFYVESGNLYLKAILKNNTDTEYPINGADISLFSTDYMYVIHNGALTKTQMYRLNFRAEDEKNDTVINAGESINVVALLASEMKTNISFCGISFTDDGINYWIDLSEYVK